LREQIEDEHQHAGEQDHELHRHLQYPVEEQTEPALGHRALAEIALHL
jgi:hypothetical protein